MAKDLRRPDAWKGPDPAARRVSQWHAVSILSSESSCPAARALRAARFLSSEAPRLPLAQCSCPGVCPCAYKHHADRRGQTRRQEELTGLRRSNRISQERRTQRGRRSTDQSDLSDLSDL
jgi:hypothetical protein